MSNFAIMTKYSNYRNKSLFSWQNEGVDLPSLDFGLIESWLEKVANSHEMRLGKLGYLFCDDDKIIEVNREFLQHDYFTDIITFDYTREDRVSGDMVISLDTVATNAEMVGATYERELMRVIVHGLLHLCGIDDKGPGEREIMEKHEDEALAMWDEMQKSKAEISE